MIYETEEHIDEIIKIIKIDFWNKIDEIIKTLKILKQITRSIEGKTKQRSRINILVELFYSDTRSTEEHVYEAKQKPWPEEGIKRLEKSACYINFP